jgi:hypothetical protein
MTKAFTLQLFALAAAILLTSAEISSQTFEEFKKQREAEFQQFRTEYNEFISQMSRQFDEYVQQRDREFTEYLNQRWSEYQVFAGMKKEEKPKPVLTPTLDPREALTAPRLLPAILPEPPTIPRPQPEPRLPLIQKSEPEKFPTHNIRFDFYGNPVNLNYDPAMIVTLPANINNHSISRFWNNASKSNYNYLAKQLGDYSRAMNLNDWGYYLLVRHTAREMYRHNPNGARLMAWFLMNRSGYKARAAYHENQVMLLLPAMQDLYEVNYQVFDGLKYYLVDGNAQRIHTYDKDFPDATRIVDMNINTPLNMGDAIETRTVGFRYAGRDYSLEFGYCLNTVKFYDDYPLAQIDLYFNAAVSRLAKESLVETLLPLVVNLPETDAANLLLNFAQTAFAYKTDPEQFGREKFFFAEEVLHYPYSDCEDRSVLFAWLVRELLGLKVIGLEYNDHVATAVKFNDDPGGSYLMHQNEKYTICDPTYINARVGMAMPQYASAAAILHETDNSHYYGAMRDKIWEAITAAGGKRAGNKQDLVFDSDGNAYATGFFKGSAVFGNTRLKADGDMQNAFVAKFNPRTEILWAQQLQSNSYSVAYHVALDHEENVYISGTFRDKIAFGNIAISTAEADIFIAKYNQQGMPVWAGKAAVDTINPSLNFIFSARYDGYGKHLGTEIFLEDVNYTAYGINFDQSGNVVLTGSSFTNTGLNIEEMRYATLEGFDPILNLKDENDRLIKQGYDPAIAGLFAAINLIKINNVVIPGSAAQEALDRFNPDFRKKAPKVYDGIARISFLKNDQGIVLINTENRRPVTIDYLKILDNSTIKITEFSDGNIQLDIIDGISLGRAIVWYNLNFVRLKKDTGDLLFDYARDNTQRLLNLKKDILY